MESGAARRIASRWDDRSDQLRKSIGCLAVTRSEILDFGALLISGAVLLFPQHFGVPGVMGAIVLLAVRGLAFAHSHLRPSVLPTTVITAMLVLGITASVGMVISIDRVLSIHKLLGLLFGLCVFVSMFGMVHRRGRSGPAFAGYLLAAQGVLIAGLGSFSTDWSRTKAPQLAPVYDLFPRWISQVETSMGSRAGIHPAELGGVLALLLPIPIALALWSSQAFQLRAAFWVCSTLIGLTLLLTLSRSAILGGVVGLITLALLRHPDCIVLRYWRAACAATVMAIALLATTLWLDVAQPLGLPTAATDPRGRPTIWISAIDALLRYPVTGIGLNSYSTLLDPHPLPHLRLPHAHNLPLQTALDLGLPGFAAFLYIVFHALRRWSMACRRFRTSPGLWTGGPGPLAGIGAGLLAYLAFSMTDAITLGAKPGYLLWFALATLAAARHSSATEPRDGLLVQAPTMRSTLSSEIAVPCKTPYVLLLYHAPRCSS